WSLVVLMLFSCHARSARPLVREMIATIAGERANGSYAVDGKPGPSIPIGWAVMSPMVVTIGDHQFAPTFVPCESAAELLYCVQFVKDGTPISERLAMGKTLMPAGMVGELAYHPPLLFLAGEKLLAVYWVRARNQRSIIQLLALDLNAPAPVPWIQLSTFE